MTRPHLPPLAAIASKFNWPKSSSTVKSLLNHTNTQEALYIKGWLQRKPKRMSKNLTFAQVRDTKGDTVQIVDRNTPSLFRNLKPDSTFTVKLAKEGKDLVCQSLHLLGEANVVPGELQAEETKDWPAKYRYIQLRQPSFQRALRSRAAIIRNCRNVLDEEGFTEIETPILFKSTPEGAREFLVPTRRKNYTYALPQSPQQYKQLLMASGIDRYYQVAKCFRDEDLRADRQPEFTQLDMELAFADAKDVQDVVTKVVKAVWKGVHKDLITLPKSEADTEFVTLDYDECIARYGIDKPDLRSQISISKIEGAVSKNRADFPVLECLVVPGTVDILEDRYKRVSFVKFESEAQLRAAISELAVVSDWTYAFAQLTKAINLTPGTLLAFADRQEVSYENPTPLGRVRQHLAETELEKNKGPWDQRSIAVWVSKFPSFEPMETSVSPDGYPQYDLDQLKATHHPFTMIDLDHYQFLESNEPLKCRGMHFDLVIDGVEVGGGSQRIHDSALQRHVLQNVVGVKDPDSLFGHLLGALDTGCPPHAGLAIGLDRMVAMALGFRSIRDVIAFPKTNAGADPVVGSPSLVDKQQLLPYHIQPM